MDTLFGKRKMFDKVKATKKNGTPDSGMPRLKAKVKILGEGLKASEPIHLLFRYLFNCCKFF